jgi:hypothetical protein
MAHKAQEASSQISLPQVQCPECGAMMRLSQVIPGPPEESSKEITIFDCPCGFEYRQSDRVRDFG